jgi:hypothetical protein
LVSIAIFNPVRDISGGLSASHGLQVAHGMLAASGEMSIAAQTDQLARHRLAVDQGRRRV